MDKVISCKDLWSGCDLEACSKSEVELFRDVLEHGRVTHGLKKFSPAFYDKVRRSIQEGYCDLEAELCQYSDCGR